MAATLEEIAYGDAVRALDGQRQLIADMRTRAAVVVSAGAVTAAVFAEPVLSKGAGPLWTWTALTATFAQSLCALSVLWPRSSSAYHQYAATMLAEWQDQGLKSSDAYGRLAEYLDDAYEADSSILGGTKWYAPGLSRLFQAARVLLVAEVVFWLLPLTAA